MTKHISIVVPVWNEEGNIVPLVERIHGAMKDGGLTYTLIFVDDRSKDKTVETIKSLTAKYPIQLLIKKPEQKRGKALSLLAGFAHATSDVVVMIDADLQYPPEAIPKMITKIDQGADVVVANRTNRKTNIIRKVGGEFFRFIFGKVLHGFDFDVQSGLKVFRKEIVERVPINPSSQWMFDLEFLVAAKNGGYSFDSVNITFEPRHSGKAKISFLKASVEMAIAATKLKIKEPRPIPFHPDVRKKKGDGFHYKGSEYISYTNLSDHEIAFHRLTQKQILLLSGLAGILIGGFLTSWHTTLVVFIATLTALYFADLLFSIFLVSRSLVSEREILVKDEDVSTQRQWPKYTVFCPLYKEWQVIPQFIRAMSQLDYPKDKLQVLLLLEEDDKESVEKVQEMNLPDFFSVRVIPHGRPKTKPKALNFGLMHATGTYAVIYDAEDVPDPFQLKKTVLAFERSPESIVCIQAKLNFYNPHQNLLTRIFTAEYSLWFDLVLPGLQSIGAPIPLGGTSNHFRVRDLISLSGWDAFNVTEDCDLGMRLAKRGYRTAIVNSTTMEEANSRIFNWYGQRSRWIKGYIQTYLVHTRTSPNTAKAFTQKDRLVFQVVVGGKILSMFINPFMWVITGSYFAFRPVLGPVIESFYPTPVLYMGALCLVFGNFLYMYSYMIGCMKREHYGLIKFALVTPFYWLAMSIAAWRAVFEIMYKPHYWSKTVHGFHLANAKKVAVKPVTKTRSDKFEHVLSEYSDKKKQSNNTPPLPAHLNILGS